MIFADSSRGRSYSERFYVQKMPKRYRYEVNWHPSPPELSDEQSEACKRLEAMITDKGDISPLAMSIISHTRIRLLEALIRRTMGDSLVTRYRISSLHNIPSRDSFTKRAYVPSTPSPSPLCRHASTGHRGKTFHGEPFVIFPLKDLRNTPWQRDCARISVFAWTHLYDELNLKAAVAAVTICLRSRSHISNSFSFHSFPKSVPRSVLILR